MSSTSQIRTKYFTHPSQTNKKQNNKKEEEKKEKKETKLYVNVLT